MTKSEHQPASSSLGDAGRVVLAGGSGALGTALADDLAARGAEVVVLTRRPAPGARHRQVQWDGRSVGPWAVELDGCAGVVNLAGRLVDARPSAAYIADLRESRVQATRALVLASQWLSRPVPRWLQASTTAIWSDAGEARLDEASPLPDPGLPQMTGVADHGRVRWWARTPSVSPRCGPRSSSTATPRRSTGCCSSLGWASAGRSVTGASGSAGSTRRTG